MDVASRSLSLATEITIVRISVSAILIVAGCASAPVEESRAEEWSNLGVVSFEQVRDPAARPPEAEADQEYRRAVLQEGFTLPVYPEEALIAGAPPTEVVIRVVVAKDGSVSNVRRSPLAGPPQNEWEELFYDVVRDTVAGWSYEPCELRELQDGPDRDDDGVSDYTMVVASTPVAVYLDLKFRFEIVAGEGQVSMGADAE